MQSNMPAIEENKLIIDARKLPANHTIQADICIIGAGVAGITLAKELMGSGLDICLLESGGIEPDSKTQALCRGKTIGHPYYPLDTARVRHFGGSSIKWLLELGDNKLGARLQTMDAIDFEKREWVPNSGWPFDRQHLDPYYARAQKLCKVPIGNYNLSDWEDPKSTPSLPFVGNRVGTSIYYCLSNEVFNEDYRKELEAASDVRVYLYANALEIEADESGQNATNLRTACINGKEFAVNARRFVVAVGGIETPRLLLLSNKVQKNGIGNQHDLVGRYFMEHPHLLSGTIFPTDKKLLKQNGLYKIHQVQGTPIIGQLKLSEKTIRQEQMLNDAIVLVTAPKPYVQGSQHAVSHGVQSVGLAASALLRRDLDEFKRHLSTLFPVVNKFSIKAYRKAMDAVYIIFGTTDESVFHVYHMAEQIPNPESRVTLISEKDHFGQKLVQLDWKISSADIRSIRRTQEIIDEELRHAGMGRLQIDLEDDTPPLEITGGWHHMGTTRMHINPKQGVVDENSLIHGMSNLYIAGPSVFPTCGCANPTLTLVALTIRLADHLKHTMAND